MRGIVHVSAGAIALEQRVTSFPQAHCRLGQRIGDHAALGHDRNKKVGCDRLAISAIDMRTPDLAAMETPLSMAAAACDGGVIDL